MVTIEKTYRIAYGDKGWKVPPDCIKEVDGETFIKLSRSSRGFASLVLENNHNVPQPIPKNYSLMSSVGYGELIKYRKAAADTLKMAGVSELFQPNFKRPKVKRKDITDSRGNPVVITITVNATPLKCLATESSQDALCMLLDSNTLNSCIDYMRDSPWDSSLKQVHGRIGCARKRKDRKGKIHFYAKVASSRKLKRLKSDQTAAASDNHVDGSDRDVDGSDANVDGDQQPSVGSDQQASVASDAEVDQDDLEE